MLSSFLPENIQSETTETEKNVTKVIALITVELQLSIITRERSFIYQDSRERFFLSIKNLLCQNDTIQIPWFEYCTHS